jgi:translation initiation factor 3 subunit L
MSDPSDAHLLPAAVRDFVFDLHDSVTRSHLPAEQSALYGRTFRDLSSKYFGREGGGDPGARWPKATAVASECGGDVTFLALYTELTARQASGRPTVSERIEGWAVYRDLFDLILAGASGKNAGGGPGLFLLPEWCFDLLHEFVYQFQGFCQFRTATYAAAVRSGNSSSSGGDDGPSSKKPVPSHVLEALQLLSERRDAWAVESVHSYLAKLVALGTSGQALRGGPAYRLLGVYASVALSRLECLLGDYASSLEALSPVADPSTCPSAAERFQLVPPEEGGGDATSHWAVARTPLEWVRSVLPARISMSYHAGVSSLMLRRYSDAVASLGDISAHLQRSFQTGALRTGSGRGDRGDNGGGGGQDEQHARQSDRIVALLAVLLHTSPSLAGSVEDGVLRAVRERHGGQLGRIDAGEEGFEDMFVYACPKFVSAAVPDYARAAAGGGAAGGADVGPQDFYRLQVSRFSSEMEHQSALLRLRSYLSLYTSLDVTKLAAFHDVPPGRVDEGFAPLLLMRKHREREGASSSSPSAAALEPASEGDAEAAATARAADLHFYVDSSTVHVDEAERERRFEGYFLGRIGQNAEIRREAAAVDTHV